LVRDRVGSRGPEMGFSWRRGQPVGYFYGTVFSVFEKYLAETTQISLLQTQERAKLSNPHLYQTRS
jgi:hypothetical protein